MKDRASAIPQEEENIVFEIISKVLSRRYFGIEILDPFSEFFREIALRLLAGGKGDVSPGGRRHSSGNLEEIAGMRKALSRIGKSEGPRIGSQLQANFDLKDPRLQLRIWAAVARVSSSLSIVTIRQDVAVSGAGMRYSLGLKEKLCSRSDADRCDGLNDLALYSFYGKG